MSIYHDIICKCVCINMNKQTYDSVTKFYNKYVSKKYTYTQEERV